MAGKRTRKDKAGGEETKRVVTSLRFVLLAALGALFPCNGTTEPRVMFYHDHCFSGCVRVRRRKEKDRSDGAFEGERGNALRGESVLQRPFRYVDGVLAPGMQIIVRCSVYRVAQAILKCK